MGEVLKREITNKVLKMPKPVKLKSICIWDSSVIVHPIIYWYAPFILDSIHPQIRVHMKKRRVGSLPCQANPADIMLISYSAHKSAMLNAHRYELKLCKKKKNL